MQPEQAVQEAEKVKLKSDTPRGIGQLANDQQGGANVGRRYLEVGLPMQALEASIKTKQAAWAGSYLFDAATAESNLERNSKYIVGFILDSQTLEPDVMELMFFLSLVNMDIKNMDLLEVQKIMIFHINMGLMEELL